MASASSLAHLNAGQSGERNFETLEIDPQYAQGLGLAQGDLVREISPVKIKLML
jgi:peroxin-1